MQENEEEISKIRNKILSRNPKAFEKKLQVQVAPLGLQESSKAKSLPGSKNVRHIKG